MKQTDKLLEYFKSGKEVSIRSIFNDLNINSPTKALSLLREAGYKIIDRWERSENSKYKVYMLVEETK